MKKLLALLTLFLCFECLSQGTFLERTSPNPASAQLFFFARTSNGVTEQNWKIATLPPSSTSSGDKIMIELFGGSHGSSSTFQQVIHMGNRNAFNGYLRTSQGEPYSSVRIRAYQQANGSVDVYFSLLSTGWKGGSVRVYEGSGIVSSPVVIYEVPVDAGANPGGTLVFDSGDVTPRLDIDNSGNMEIPGTFKMLKDARSVTIHPSSDGNSYFNYSGGDSDSRIGFQIDGSSKMSIMNNGYVGIGTGAPDQKLTVQGNVNVGGTGNGAINVRHVNGKSHTSAESGSLFLNYSNGHSVVVGKSTAAANFYVHGKVGIGITSPSEELEVNGTIRSKEVKVEASPWPDYVFEPTYELRTLEETEAYIKENRHLPEMPSAAEVEAHGASLGEMNMLLLKKIEELTLYQIEMQKKIKELEQKVEDK